MMCARIAPEPTSGRMTPRKSSVLLMDIRAEDEQRSPARCGQQLWKVLIDLLGIRLTNALGHGLIGTNGIPGVAEPAHVPRK